MPLCYIEHYSLKQDVLFPDVTLQFMLQILQDFSHKETVQHNGRGSVNLKKDDKDFLP